MRILIVLSVSLCVFGCSLFRSEVEPKRPSNAKNTETVAELTSNLASSSSYKTPGLTLSECAIDRSAGDPQEDCEPWLLISPTPTLKLCNIPLAVYQQRRPLSVTDGAEGSEVRWAILIYPFTRSDDSRLIPPGRLTQKLTSSVARWRIIWEGSISSEMLASAHAESVYTHTTLLPQNRQKLGEERPCRDFLARRQQSARSFHRVDAHEREFDEDDIEETHFHFDLEHGVYRLIEREAQPQIKVRSR